MKNSIKTKSTKNVVTNVVTNVVSETAILNAVTKKVNQYKTDVLDVNANFKTALRTTNKAIKLLIASETLSIKQVSMCKAILRNDDNYKSFDALVRRTPSKMVTPFYVLQALYKVAKK